MIIIKTSFIERKTGELQLKDFAGYTAVEAMGNLKLYRENHDLAKYSKVYVYDIIGEEE